MKQRCALCGRGSMKVNSRSHSKRATIRRQKVNLQKRSVGGTRMLICARCLKTQVKIPAYSGAKV